MGLAMIKQGGSKAIHVLTSSWLSKKDVDARPKAGHDERELF